MLVNPLCSAVYQHQSTQTAASAELRDWKSSCKSQHGCAKLAGLDPSHLTSDGLMDLDLGMPKQELTHASR